jgi:hypothetical protein
MATCYSGGNGSGGPDLARIIDTGGAFLDKTILQPVFNLGPLRPDCAWINPTDTDDMRMFKGDRMSRTWDDWASLTQYALTLKNLELIEPDIDDYSNVLVGDFQVVPPGNIYHVYKTNDEAVTTTPWSGNDVLGGANSISQNAGGLSFSGIHIFEA